MKKSLERIEIAVAILEGQYRSERERRINAYGVKASQEIELEATCTAKAFPVAIRIENVMLNYLGECGDLGATSAAEHKSRSEIINRLRKVIGRT